MSEGSLPRGNDGGGDVVSRQNAGGSRRGAEAEGKGGRSGERGGARLWQPRRRPPPPSRPRAPVTHMRARALSGSSRLGDTSRRARRLGQQLPASGSSTRKRFSRLWSGLEHKGKPLCALRSKTDRARARAGQFSRYLESLCSCAPWRLHLTTAPSQTQNSLPLPLFFFFSFGPSSLTQIPYIYTRLTRLYLLPADSVAGIPERFTLTKLLQQFY